MDWIEILTLGVIQGLTEFLPISSDGHLTVANHVFAALRGSSASGKQNLFVIVVLHVGTLAAILVHYRATIAAGLKGFLANPKPAPRVEGSELAPDSGGPSPYRRPMVSRVLTLGVIATLPVVPVGLFLKDRLEKTFEDTAWSGAGFLVTAAVLLLTTLLKEGDKGPERTTWLDALLVGVAQMFAPLPGVSRSGLTIAAALALGFSRTWAVGFSLLMAVIGIAGALVLELKDPLPNLTPLRMAQIAAGTAVAFAVGYAAILWLVRVVQSGKVWYFSVYLIVLGAVVLGWSLTRGRTPNARHPTALDRPERVGGARPGDAGRPRGNGGDVDRPDSPGARAGHAKAGRLRGDRACAAGLVLARPLAGRAGPSA